VGRIVYDMSVSLDGRVASPEGSLDWVAVDVETHRLFNDEARAMSAFLLGRRMYEILQAFWPTADADPEAEDVIVDFAHIWREKPKYVFSRTLESVDATATLLREVRREEIERLKAAGDLSVGGPGLAHALIELGLVDELLMYVNPVVLGGGTRYLPEVREPMTLRLKESRALSSGVVRLAYAVSG